MGSTTSPGDISSEGSLDVSGDARSPSGGSTWAAIVNGGTIKKSAGASGSSFNVPLTLHCGSRRLVQNTIRYRGTVTSNGATLDVSSGATAYFYYTTASSFDAASTISGAG